MSKSFIDPAARRDRVVLQHTFALALALVWVLLTSCMSVDRKTVVNRIPPISMTDLLLDIEADIPRSASKFQTNRFKPEVVEPSLDAEALKIKRAGDSKDAIQSVNKYRNVSSAANQIYAALRLYYANGFFDKPPAWWTYKSPIADQWLVGCTETMRKSWSCSVIARYDEYILSFDSVMEMATQQELQELVKAMDERITNILAKSKPVILTVAPMPRLTPTP